MNSLAALAMFFSSADVSYRKQLFKLFAYVGRYAHCGLEVALKMPVSDLYALADATAELLDQEKTPNPEG